MNMPVLTATHSSPPPTDNMARAADAGVAQDDAPAFSNVLSQQRGAAAKESIPSASGRTAASRADTADKQDSLGPDDTLALILDSTALPLMQAATQAPHIALRHPAGSSALKADVSASGQSTHPRGQAGALLADDVAADSAHASQNTPGDTAQRSPRPFAGQAALAPFAHPQRQDTTTPPGSNRNAAGSRSAAALATATDDALPVASASSGIASQPRLASPSGAPDAPAAMIGQTSSTLGATLLPTAVNQPAPQLTVPTLLNSPQWPQDFSRQVLNLTQAGISGHTVQMHVNPPELGPIHITLHLGESTAQASFISPHANVRQALENALPHLEQQLAQAGLSLGEANVNDRPGSQQQTGQPSQGPSEASNGMVFSLDGNMTAASNLAPPPAPRSAARPDALVDTFV